jgi:hypothetical protein
MKAVNLLPGEARSRGGLSFRPRPAHAVALVLLALAVMALLYGQARNTASHAESEAITVRNETAAVERASAVDAAAAAKVPAFEKYVTGVAKVATARYGWAPLFHALAVTIPAHVEYTGMTMDLGASTGAAAAAAAAAMAEPQPATMLLKGCAYHQDEVAKVMRTLRGVPDVSEVALSQSTEASGSASTSNSNGCPQHGPSFEMTVSVAAPKPWAGAPLTEVVSTKQAVEAVHAKSEKKGAKR